MLCACVCCVWSCQWSRYSVPDAISICGEGWWRNDASKVLNRAGLTWQRLLSQRCIFAIYVSFWGGRLSRFQYLGAIAIRSTIGGRWLLGLVMRPQFMDDSYILQ